MSNDEAQKRVDIAVSQLGEHFAHVQILVSWEKDPDDTLNLFRGSGNWFARQGMAREFLIQDDARTRNSIIKREEGGEST